MIGRLIDVAPYAAGFIAFGVLVILVGCLIAAAAGQLTEAEPYAGLHVERRWWGHICVAGEAIVLHYDVTSCPSCGAPNLGRLNDVDTP